MQTHIDPFAPGNSPQHPSNWGRSSEAPEVHEDPDVVRYRELLEQFGTDEEKAASLSVEPDAGDLATFEDLEARQEDDEVYRARLDAFGTAEEKARDGWSYWELHARFDFGTAPAPSAVKAEWLAYAQRVAAVRGEEIPRNSDGEPGTIAQLQEYASHAHELPENEGE